MIRSALLACALVLSACGDGSGSGKAASKPARPVSTPTEKAALLAALPAPYDAADLENGRRVFARCRSCHTITEGGPNMTGPNLHGVFGREAGTADKYNYSTAVRDADFVWDAARLDDWLENPRTFLKGTKMSFAGIPKAQDRADVITYLESLK